MDLTTENSLVGKVEALHQLIWTRLREPVHGQFYTFINPRTGLPVLPTTDEVLRCIPNTAGWQTPIEDCCVCAGTYVTAMLLRYEGNPTGENEAAVRAVFHTLRTLGSCGRRRGFIARGLLPDGLAYYPDTSVDQYTMFIYGLWRYYHSGVATEEEKRWISSKLHDICYQFEEDEFYIQNDAGSAATFGDINAMVYGRVERVLQPFAVGWQITGDEHLHDVYEQLKAEQQGRRLEILRTEVPPGKGHFCLYAHTQTQIALGCLLDIEPDADTRAIYSLAMRRIGEVSKQWIEGYREFPDLQFPQQWEMDWRADWNNRRTDNIWNFYRQLFEKQPFLTYNGRTIREPSEAMLNMLLTDDTELHRQAAQHFQQMMETVNWDNLWIADDANYVEQVYHLIRKAGVL